MSIRSELETPLYNWGVSNNIPISFENVAFQKPSNSVWVECFILNRLRQAVTVDATRAREKGTFQINIYVPQATGTKQGEDLVSSISSLYPIIPKTGTVSIEAPASIARSIPLDNGWRMIPLRIEYRQEQGL